MSITKYTNFETIDINKSNQGEFLTSDDRFIVTKNEVEDTDFGDCKYDVMEVSVYDVNNNLLPHKSGNNVAYIKTGDIKNYLYNITNKGGQKELAIDIEKVLNDLGFTNGILKVIINFVRNRIGSDDTLSRVWIQQISPSREEVRILPLKTDSPNINNQTNLEFNNVNNLSKDFKYYRKNILDALDSFEVTYLESITDTMVAKFGKDFQSVLRKDFGLSDFSSFKKRIFSDFKDSVTYWVTNRYYKISDSNFGKPSEIRFIDCEQYAFNILVNEMYSILRDCIDFHTKTLKRRDIAITTLPKEFEITQLKKDVKDLVGNISINENRVRNVYNPTNVELNPKGTQIINPPIQIKEEPPIKILPIELPPAPIEPEPIPIRPIRPEPIEIIEPTPEPPPPIQDIIPTPVQDIIPTPVQDIIPTPSYGGGGGGGGSSDYFERGGGYGREQVFERDANQRENIQ
jgi:hypothetical protein